MAVYFADTEITGIKDLFPLSSKDITGLYFGDTELFTVWGEYDGTLPAQYSANGSMLADYRIYGASGGVGDETANLFNVTNTVPVSQNYCYCKIVMEIEPNTTYYIKNYTGIMTGVYVYGNPDYTSEQIAIGYSRDNLSFNSGAYRICYMYIVLPTGRDYRSDKIYIGKGSTAPSEYVPYGYEVDMSVSDGTTSTTTPIYIGDEPLYEDEYVDYASGKISKRTEQLWDGVLYAGYFTSRDFILNDSSRPYIYKSIKVWLQPGNYVLTFNPIVYLVRTLLNGVYSEYSYNTGEVHFTVNSEGYVGFSFRNTSNNRWADNPSTISVKGIYSIDPPVPLPALPTVDGVNIVDYAGQSAAVPSRFMAKYRKEGFN